MAPSGLYARLCHTFLVLLYFTNVPLTMLQVLDRPAGIPVLHVAVADELHHRVGPADARRSFCFLLLGVRQEEGLVRVSCIELVRKITQVCFRLLRVGERIH